MAIAPLLTPIVGPALGGFLGNAAASIGLNIISSWLSPKKSTATVEDSPGLSAGSKIYCVAGLSFCPTNLLYFVPAATAGHGDDKSTFGVLGFCNPDATGDLVAVRSNNNIVATSSPLFKRRMPASQIGQGTYLGPGGLTAYNDFQTYKYQLSTTVVANPHFGLLNYPSLQFQGMTWFSLQNASRQLFGGTNARTTLYCKNLVSSTVSGPYSVKTAQPLSINIIPTIPTKGFGTSTTKQITYDFPNGFHGARVFRHFEGSGGFDLIGVGGGKDFVVYQDIPAYSSIKFSANGAILANQAATTQGQYSTTVNTGTLLGNFTTLIIGQAGGQLSQVTIPSNPAPFRSNNGQIFNGSNTLVVTLPAGTRVYGWGGTMFVNGASDPFYDAIPNWDTATGTTATGNLNEVFTTLEIVVRDLYRSKYPSATVTTIGAQQNIRGFTYTYDDVAQTITNLANAFGRFIYDDEAGNLTIIDYPPLPSTPIALGVKDWLEPPSVTFTPIESSPNTLEFIYRDYASEFAEKSIRVAYGSIEGDGTSTRMDIVATQAEATKMAWTILWLQNQATASLKVRVADITGIGKGSVIRADIRNVSESAVIKHWLVADIELGRDRTFILTCVNWIPLASYLAGAGFNTYMLATASEADNNSTVTPVSVVSTGRSILAEPTQLLSFFNNFGWYGALFHGSRQQTFTSGPGPYASLTLTNISVNNFAGYVQSVTWRGGRPSYGIASLVLRRNPGTSGSMPSIGALVRVGTCWVKGDPVISGETFTFNFGTLHGLFGSEMAIFAGDNAYYLDQNNTVGGLNQLTPGVLNIAPVVTSVEGTIAQRFSYDPVADVGVVSTRYPEGNPAPGWMVANIVTNYVNGEVVLYIARPGSQQGSILVEPVYPTSLETADYWISVNNGAYVFLTTINSASAPIVRVPFAIPAGATYRLAARGAGGTTVWYAGSYRFSGQVL